MRQHSRFGAAAVLLLVWVTAGCASSRPAPPRVSEPAASAADPAVRITLLHFNDVYEITPVEGGRRGGLARVATLRERLTADNPNTLTVLAGDLFSPSALGTAKVGGERLAGRQMVAVLNALGLDLATFGNHEFDLGEEAFRRRMEEARFEWVSANVTEADGRPFPGVPPHRVLTFDGPGGRTVRLGVFGLTLGVNPASYVAYTDPLAAAKEQVAALRGQVDILVALTHLSVEQDVALAEACPEIDLILGGHEHENMQLRRGGDFTPVLKADANVRSVWVHELSWTGGGGLEVDSRFVVVSDQIPEDPATRAVVEEWVERGFEGFRQEGFVPDQVVVVTPESLDGREAVVRSRPTRLTELIGEALFRGAGGEAGQVRAALYNSGAIRIDDVIPPGPLTQYDVLRILPFSDELVTVRMSGELLLRALEQGAKSRGTGAYLQLHGITGGPGAWRIQGQEITAGGTYPVAVNSFLVSGKEQGMGFLSPGAEGLETLAGHGDVRQAVITELERAHGGG